MPALRIPGARGVRRGDQGRDRRAETARPAHLPALRRVGHKGAGALTAPNTVASFEAALALGVDMIEFDVLRGADGSLVIAHDPEDAAARAPLSLADALDHLAGARYARVELDVDLKHPGFEFELLDALRARGLEHRSLLSSAYPSTLERVGALAPGVRRGLSVPRARRDYLRSVYAPPALAYMVALRARLPRRAATMLRSGRCEAVMAHWMLVTPRLVGAVRSAGGQLFVWTVDDPTRIRALEGLGVDGVITNDPRLFDAGSAPVV